MTRTDPNEEKKESIEQEPHSADERGRIDAQQESGLAEYEYQYDVEPFVPTDFYPSTHVRGKRGRKRRKKRVLWAVLLVLGILLLMVGGVFAYVLLLDPSAQFANSSQQNPTDVVSVEGEGATNAPGQPTPTPSPTIDLYEVISAQADNTLLQQNIVNVLLIGVDYSDERETWSGKHEYHSDVMIIMAINFDENRVDLISLPRDTFAKIPGIRGIYKLNASINCGGGYDAPGGAGFLKTCEAATWMLGEAGQAYPINYYYAVTMPAVKQLVNVVGGVDYNLELDFKIGGRSYRAGPTHLSGQGVLDYLRVRKNVQGSGDLNRINRQKEMLIAIFQSMQEQNLILKIPDILSSFEGQLYTNCTFGQTAALTKFAYSLDKDNIGMYSMGGTMKNIFNWNFCITNQNNRVDIIHKVYGIDASKELEYTEEYADYRWADLVASQYLKAVEPLTEFVSAALAEDDLLPTMSPTPDPTPTPEIVAPSVTDTPAPTAEPTPTPTETVGGTSQTGSDSFGVVRLSAKSPVRGETYRRFSDQSRENFNTFLMSLDDLEEAQAIARKEASNYAAGKSNNLDRARQDVSDYASHVKTNALSLAQEFGYPTGNLDWSCRYDLDKEFNEVTVDFR